MKQQFFPQRLFMDMKRLIINRLVGLGLLVVGALVSCNAPTAFVPVPSPNPWVDDYTALSSNGKITSSGERIMYTIRPVKKIGDTYYMYSTDAIFAENRKRGGREECTVRFYPGTQIKKIWYIGILWDGPFPKIPAPAIEWVHSQAERKKGRLTFGLPS